jgi:hypothetical protein
MGHNFMNVSANSNLRPFVTYAYNSVTKLNNKQIYLKFGGNLNKIHKYYIKLRII